MIDGLVLAANSDALVGQEVDLGSGTLVSVREVVEHLLSITGVAVTPHWGALPDRPQEQFRAAAVADTYAATGWQATTSLHEGLRRTVDGYRAQGGTKLETHPPSVMLMDDGADGAPVGGSE